MNRAEFWKEYHKHGEGCKDILCPVCGWLAYSKADFYRHARHHTVISAEIDASEGTKSE